MTTQRQWTKQLERQYYAISSLKAKLNKDEFKGKRPKPTYLRNFGRDHQRKKFNKPKESQTAQSQVASKPVEGNNKKEGTVRMKRTAHDEGLSPSKYSYDQQRARGNNSQ